MGVAIAMPFHVRLVRELCRCIYSAQFSQFKTRRDAQRKRAGRKATAKHCLSGSPRDIRRGDALQSSKKWAFPRAVGREGAEAGRSDSDQSQVRALAGD